MNAIAEVIAAAFRKKLPGLVLEGVPSEVFVIMSFDGPAPQGTGDFHEGCKAVGETEGSAAAVPRPCIVVFRPEIKLVDR